MRWSAQPFLLASGPLRLGRLTTALRNGRNARFPIKRAERCRALAQFAGYGQGPRQLLVEALERDDSIEVNLLAGRFGVELTEGLCDLLHQAAAYGCPAVTNSLVAQGMDVNKPHPVTGEAPLHYAARAKQGDPKKVVEVLVRARANVGARGGAQQDTPLHTAVACSNVGAALVLLEAGADPEAANSAGDTPFACAFRNGSMGADMLGAMLDAGAKLEGEAGRQLLAGTTLLHLAVMYGAVRRVRALMGIGADPLAFDVGGQSPLGYALSKGHAEVLRAMLEGGAPLGPADPCHPGATWLHLAALSGRAAEVDTLLRAGVGPSTPAGVWGPHPLHYAAYAGQVGVAEMLLAAGADLGASEGLLQRTPLHWAAMENIFPGSHGPSVPEDRTAGREASRTGVLQLDRRRQQGKAAVARLLLAAGAAVAADKEGATCLDLATEHGTDEVMFAVLAAAAQDN